VPPAWARRRVTYPHIACYVRAVAAVSDMGGREEFFGPIIREADEPVFHSRAEGRVFGISGFVLALAGRNLDAFRFAMEQLPRELYMSGYYRRMLGGCENLLVRLGYLGTAEVDARLAGRLGQPDTRRGSKMRLTVASRLMRAGLRPTFPRWIAARVLPRVFGSSRPAFSRPRFSIGDPVRVRSVQASGHTRQPGYVTGKPGVITARLGATLFPDAHAVGRRTRPQHLYTVAFEGTDLWGERAERDTEVCVDLYEPYLEPA
jgi:nitrile hydratase subunit beta